MLPTLTLLASVASLAVASSNELEARNNWPVATVQVDLGQRFQEVDGFGSSQAFQRAEDLLGKFGLSPTNITRLLDLLYDVDKGAGFTILR